jgi:hypothetical protein
MKALHLSAVGLAGALGLMAQTTLAQSWYTVDDFQYSPRKIAFATGLAKDPTGTIIYSVGNADDASGVRHHVVFETVNGGTNWSLIDDYTGSADSIRVGSYPAIAADPAGNLYASDGGSANGSSAWFVRSLPAGGSSWVTADLLLGNGYPSALATDSAGNVYVVGSGQSLTWLVRKGTPTSSGISWANVDVLTSPIGSCSANGVFCHPTAGVFVVGSSSVANGSSSQSEWIVRRSQDGGATWVTVDTFQLPSASPKLSNGASYAQGVGADAVGNLYVVGTASQQSGLHNTAQYSDHWLVRKSTNPGATSPSWSTVDNFQLSPTSNAGAWAIASDVHGNLFVAGKAANASGWQWVVRESVGSAGTWNTVDTFHYGTIVFVYAALGDSLGNVFVAGEGIPVGGGLWHWLVRKN